MLRLIGLLLTLWVTNTTAATVGIHLTTAHFGQHNLEADTPGVYVRTDSGFTAGVYRNSYRRTSAYTGWTWETESKRFAITVGAVTGYSASKVMPLVVPSAKLDLGGGFSSRIAFIPKPVKKGHAAGVHFAIERSF